MRFIYSILAVCVLLIGGLGCGKVLSSTDKAVAVQSTPKVSEEAPRISLEDAKKDFDAGTAIFVDSRPADSYKIEHIKGAINIPFADAETRWKEIPTDKKIIVYCS